ncbi:MAG: AbrB/MazE/SpoVT family DNA-binding domain-containing protein [Firmicutes bacterium]|nr:AbrB/MazE/SpoVT family DNA-binding domain-containing protein [Bacillota bacterium]
MHKYTIQVRDRGVVTLPKAVRQRYALAPDTPLTLIDLDGVLLLSTRIPVVTALAQQIASERERAGLSVEDLLAAWRDDRYGWDEPLSSDT